jgi:hypothetical protein
MDDVVIVTGPCGVGKSSVGFECMEILERRGVAAAMIDGELAYFCPKPPDDAFGYAVAWRRQGIGTTTAQRRARGRFGRLRW